MAGKAAWNRFFKNKAAIAGLVFVLLTLFCALFAKLISPDATPNANRQLLEIAGQRPGFKHDFIKIVKDDVTTSYNCGLFVKLTKGCPDNDTYIPVKHWHVEGKNISFEKFNGEGRHSTTEVMEFSVKPGIVNKKFLLGTDQFGRDMFSRILLGSRVSLWVGFMSVLISLLIGITVGSTAGYYGGKLDNVLMWLANVVWSLPTILLAMAIAFLMKGANITNPKMIVFIAIGLSMWVDVARIVRGQVFSVKQEPYVQAIQGFGASHFRVITKHILPNIIGPILVIAAANFASAVLIEAGLSFIGIGIDPPEPSWGVLLSENKSYLFTGKNAFMALVPGIAIMLLVMSFNLLGNGLRDAFDVKR